MDKIKKDKLYQELHRKLAKKYHSTRSFIHTLRLMMLGFGKTKQEVMEMAAKKASGELRRKTRHGSPRKTKKHYMELYNWLVQLNDKDLKQILKAEIKE